MALVVFIRGANVGGNRVFRPRRLAQELSRYGVVNVGAAGTFVVRNPGSRQKFLAALRRKLPFEAEIALCDGRELIQLEQMEWLMTEAPPATVRFVSILTKRRGSRAAIPLSLPEEGEWLVRAVASQGRFVLGEYRRHMKTIGYLGRLDKHFGAPATTRNRNTILAVLRILKGGKKKGKRGEG